MELLRLSVELRVASCGRDEYCSVWLRFAAGFPFLGAFAIVLRGQIVQPGRVLRQICHREAGGRGNSHG